MNQLAESIILSPHSPRLLIFILPGSAVIDMSRHISVAVVLVIAAFSVHVEAGSRTEFLTTHCADCHQGKTAEANLDITALDETLASPDAFDAWVKIVDRVSAGEMPPKDHDRPDKTETQQFLNSTADWLTQHQENVQQTSGRVPTRRLTNRQLERTLHDLLGIDIPLAAEMPDEPRTHGFTTVASGQSTSHFQLQTHLKIVDLALDEAFRRATSEPDEWQRTFSAREVARRNPRRRCREPEMLDGNAVVWSSRLIFYGRLPVTTAREAGWYRLKLNASALNVPEDHGVWCTVRTGMCVSSAPMLSWAGAFEADEQPHEWIFEAWLPKGHMFEVRPGDATLKMGQFAGGQVGAGEGTSQNLCGLAHHSIELERFHKGPDNEVIRQQLFGDLDLKTDQRGGNAKLASAAPRKDATRLMTAFAQRAFRRPTSVDDIAPFIQLVHDDLENGVPLLAALRGGYRALLCSPRFTHFHEVPGQLDGFAFAARLSYLIWGSMPDQELLNLAASGEILDPVVCRAQTQRLLSDARGRSFVKDFAHEWLDLSEIDFTEPDRRLYGGFDVIVQESMVDETRKFLQDMLDQDLSVSHLIEADFTYLNSRLARYYGISGVTGDRIQRVSLKPDDPRGGVLTQGAIMKVTANGTNTSPVIRGVWVSERLLGVDIPPPPENVPAIEPDIRGAKTIREMLEKHKSVTECASCHRRIDPPGFALENFDPSGRWRERYLTVSRGRRSRGAVIDAGFEMPDGSQFDDLAEFKHLVLQDRSALAANVVRKLTAYGTGAPVQFADRDEVARIVGQSADAEFGFRTLLQNFVASNIFRIK